MFANSIIYLVNKYFFCLFLVAWFEIKADLSELPNPTTFHAYWHGELKSGSWSGLTTFSFPVHFIKGSQSSKSMLPFKLNNLVLRKLRQMSEKKIYIFFWWGANIIWFLPKNNVFHEWHLSFIVMSANIDCSVSLSIQFSLSLPYNKSAIALISIFLYHLYTLLFHIPT